MIETGQADVMQTLPRPHRIGTHKGIVVRDLAVKSLVAET
jgi:hypothetical protein